MTDILINDQEKTQGRPYGNGDGGGRDACIAARSQKRPRTDHLVLYTRNCVQNISFCFKKESSYFLGKRLKATVPLHPHATANVGT